MHDGLVFTVHILGHHQLKVALHEIWKSVSGIYIFFYFQERKKEIAQSANK